MLTFLILMCITLAGIAVYKHTSKIHWTSPNWNPKTQAFFNYWNPKNKVITLKAFWGFLTAPAPKWPKKIDAISVKVLELSEKLIVTNIGHATILIQMNNVNIITDPVFSNRVGPLGIGPKRIVAPGIPIEQLPPIHVAFISHNHYDHLDKYSVNYLAKHHNITFVVPLGIKRKLEQWNVQRPIIELDWWQTFEFSGVNIAATPAQHWSKRTLLDTNKTLWMGGIFRSTKGSIFFAGDTGFGPHFEEIAKRYPKIDIGLLPIGAYKPEPLMKEQHMGPKDALKSFEILKADYLIPIHYDVFPLGKESYLEAESDLFNDAKNMRIPEDQLGILKVGQQFHLPAKE